MSYYLRDRADGQVEIVLSRPILVGIFPERNTAERVRAMLSAEDPETEVDEPSGVMAAASMSDASEPIEDEVSDAPAVTRAQRINLPVPVASKPKPPAQRRQAEPHNLTDEQVQQAFTRIQDGEKIHAVAVTFGISMGQLRGMWANHKRQMQKFMAEGGQQSCSHCQRLFTPSISNPETCARCSG